MNITRVSRSGYGAVTLAMVWEHLRVDTEGSPPSSPLDSTYERNIITATEEFERSTRTAVLEQTIRVSVGSVGCEGIRLVNPTLSVQSVQYYDGDNTLQTVDSADYYLTDDFPPFLRFVTGWAKPTLYDRPDAVRVNIVAGFEATGSPPTEQSEYLANVPKAIQDAVLLRVELAQANTSPQDQAALERAIEAIESGFRVPLSQS